MTPLWLACTAVVTASTGVIEADLVETSGFVLNHNLCLLNIFNKNEPTEPFVETIGNKWTHYCANITIGSPPQPLLVQLDTGSSDLWVPGKVIRPDGFSPSQSSTFKYLNQDYYVRYVKDYAQGYWGMDTVTFPGSGISLPDQAFGVATKIPESTVGVLGIGPGNKDHTSLVSQMAAKGINNRNAFSIYLGSQEHKNGKILFGGVDKAKYSTLSPAPMKSNASYTIGLDNLSIGNYTTGGMDVVLDTGTSLMYLPDDVVSAIAIRFGAIFNPGLGMYVLTAEDHPNMPNGVTLKFGETTINIGKSDLFWPLSYFTLEVSPYRVLTIVGNKQSMGINVLGSTFLRSAYVLFEPDFGRIMIGQFIDSDETNIVAI